MRYVRLRGPDGVENGRIDGGHVVTESGKKIELLDPVTIVLAETYELLAPVNAPEVWCAGVTYERSRDARVEESAASDVYTLVYDAPRPELFLKDAAGRRTVGPGKPVGIRDDSSWNVPEPEIGVVLGEHGKIVGLTIGNDVSSRDIEGANPLYLPQAKIYAGACAIGPAIYVPEHLDASLHIRMRVTDEYGQIVFEGETSTANMRRSYSELVQWLLLDNPVPAGSVLLTGTGIVPPDSFSLRAGHFIEIHVPEIGTLANPVVRAADLMERSTPHD
jgi:2-dehydro-3-deoxy-D-arabinonate dehydratase